MQNSPNIWIIILLRNTLSSQFVNHLDVSAVQQAGGMCAWVQQVWLCMKLKTLLQQCDHFTSCLLHLRNNMQSTMSWNKQYDLDSWRNSFRWTSWQLNWWLLSKYCLRLMLSNRVEHVYRRTEKPTRGKSHSNYIKLRFHTVVLSLHLSFSLPFLNTFLFLLSHFSIRQGEIRNAGTHCHSRLPPPPLTPLT